MNNIALPTNPIKPTEIHTISPKVIKKIEEVIEEKPKELGHERLLKTLYFIHDMFDRSELEFFVVRDTGRSVTTQKPLKGDHIDIGIRRLSWNPDTKALLYVILENEHVTIKEDRDGQFITCVWEDVPIIIHLYEDSESLRALVPVVYEYEHFKLPNRFDLFDKDVK